MVLVSLQTCGKSQPLFFVHGATGIMPLGRYLVRRLGPDQPFYAVNASGFYPGQAVIESARDMVQAYVAEIISVRPSGPLIVAGMCLGGLLAIEIVRELQARDRKVGPVILADPPAVPGQFVERIQRLDPRQPQIARQLYEQVRRILLDYASRSYNDMPFDCNDPEKMHLATLAGVGSLVALWKHVPTPFSGRAVLILTAKRAPGFFHPNGQWRTILPGPQTVHVLPSTHTELFQSGLEQFTRVFNFILKEIATSDTSAECQLDYASNA
jgi:thioesterase domain-containing protein